MRDEQAIRKALGSHLTAWNAMQENSEKLREIAKDHHKTPEWIRGYMEGVTVGYKFALGEDSDAA